MNPARFADSSRKTRLSSVGRSVFSVDAKSPSHSVSTAAILRMPALMTAVEMVSPARGLLLAMTFSNAPLSQSRSRAA